MKRAIVSLVFIAALSVGFLGATKAYAYDPLAPACSTGSQDSGQSTAGNTVCSDRSDANNRISGTNSTFVKTTRLIAIMAGSVAIIMMFVGGLQYINSNGDSGKINTAKNTILYAFVGLVIIAIAQAIITFIVSGVTK